ncbi:MAG: ribonuclease J [Chloroflexota bacterium]|nr:ribonuclease J [Chloroflexota bacterium]
MSKKLRILPLGGLGEVGKNMMVYEYDDNIIIVDTGIMFPENDMLGIDYIIPDFEYLLSKRDKIRAIIITHGHEDHTGAITHVIDKINVPIYATRLTRGLVEVKLERAGLLDSTSLSTVNAGDTINIGPFQVEFFHVCHSIPDTVGLGITTPAGLVVHTTDYKFDPTPVDGWPTDFAKLAEFSSRGVLALLADSTNADKPGWTPSEKVIGPAFDEVFNNAPGRILVASFASLISRMQQVVDTTERYNRKVAFVGYSMRKNSKMAKKLGYLDVPKGIEVSLDEALKLPADKTVLMCTGSQGEPMSIMGRLSAGTNRRFGLEEDDTIVLSAHPIPGNEEGIYRTINQLFRRGANVLYEPLTSVHVSGHAKQDEMTLMLHLVKPKYLIPTHGELRHLKQHAVIARNAGMPSENVQVIENGQIVEFMDGELQLGDRIPGGYIFVDGSRVGEVGPSVMREREALAKEGVVLISLVLNNKGVLMEDPEVITRGFVYKHDQASDELMDDVRKHAIRAVKRSKSDIYDHVIQTVRSYLYSKTKSRPMVLVTISWV